MFRVNLSDLERFGTVRIERSIAKDDPMWDGVDATLFGSVDADLIARATATGQVVVSGVLRAPFLLGCRRCLEPVERVVRQDVEMLWTVPDEIADDEEMRLLDPRARELDLTDAIREEVLLAAPLYVECREECKGLCPRCGTSLNDGECGCVLDEPDSRWDALRALKDE